MPTAQKIIMDNNNPGGGSTTEGRSTRLATVEHQRATVPVGSVPAEHPRSSGDFCSGGDRTGKQPSATTKRC